MADKFPAAQVIATDLSPIQPQWVPPNLHFQVDDCESDWTFKQSFDLIHMRNLSGSIEDWPKLLKTAYDNLKPGGYLEALNYDALVQTDDNSIPQDSSIFKWQDNLYAAATRFGRPLNTASKLKEWLHNAGFIDVQEEISKAPLSPWAKDEKLKRVGIYMEVLFADSVEPYTLALYTRVLGWTPEEVTVFLADVRKDARNRKYHLFTKLYRVWAKKPEMQSSA